MVSVTRCAALAIAGAFAASLLGATPALAAPPTVQADPLRAMAEPRHAPAGPLRVQPVPSQTTTQPEPADVIFVEVSPSTMEPGFLVGIRASCRDNSVPAIVVSDAFGRVQVQPQRGLLTAAPVVKDRVRPGNYRVKLECPSGQTASTMLQVVQDARRSLAPSVDPGGGLATDPPSRGPATGFGGTAGTSLGGLLLPMGLALTVAGAIVGVVALRRPRTVRGTARR